MSLWSKLKQSVDAGISSVQSTYNDLISYPTEVQCPSQACLAITPIPPEIFNWKCINGHINLKELTVCIICSGTKQQVKYANLHNPRVNCIRCRRLIDVSETKAVSWATTQANNAPTNLQKALDEVKSLADQPDIFHCEHCSSELSLPAGPWQCRNAECMQQNDAQQQQCVSCKKDRFYQGVICGICTRNTTIPAYKIADHFYRLTHSVQATGQGYFRFVKQEPYCLCSLCENPIVLNEEQAKFLLNESEYHHLLQEQHGSHRNSTSTASNDPNNAYANTYASYSTYQPPSHPSHPSHQHVDPYANQQQLYPNTHSIVLDDINSSQQEPSSTLHDKALDGPAPPSYEGHSNNHTPLAQTGLYSKSDSNQPHADDFSSHPHHLTVACVKCHKINTITHKDLVLTKDKKKEIKNQTQNQTQGGNMATTTTTTTTTTTPIASTKPSQKSTIPVTTTTTPTHATTSTNTISNTNTASKTKQRNQGSVRQDEQESLIGDHYSQYPTAPPPDYS